MDIVETRTSVWEALAGRPPGRPPGPGEEDLWRAVVDRLNPAKARPVLRRGIERVEHTSVRGERYVMLRSPGLRDVRYLRLTPDEVALALRMDGSRTVAALVGDFAKISGRLAPENVLRVVADLAANRMLAELPIDAFIPLERVRARHRPLPVRIGGGLLAAVRGQRMVLLNPDRAAALAYRCGGRLLFTRAAAAGLALVIIAGLAAFVNAWIAGVESVFLVGDSYVTGALVLLGLNVVALACHEFGHALAAKHAGRRVPALGVLMYFGIPSVFVDTTDVWLAGRRARLITSMAGPVASLAFAGGAQLIALAFPAVAPLAFKLAVVWYLNSLFNLNPLMALDGYYALMDWLELPNLRPRAIVMLMSWVRRREPRWSDLDREGRMIACYAVAAVLWLAVMVNLLIRLYRDRVSGIVVGLWHTGPLTQLLLVAIVAGLLSPVVYAVAGWVRRRVRRYAERRRERRREADLPRRVETLYWTGLRDLPAAKLTELAQDAHWAHPNSGEQVAAAGAAVPGVLVVAYGTLEARLTADPPGTIRARANAGELIGVSAALTGAASALTWLAIGAGTRLLVIPAGVFTRVVGPLVKTPPADKAEAEALLASSPALAALSDVDRLATLPHMRAVDVAPGKRVTVRRSGTAAVIAAGTMLSLSDHGRLAVRGDLIGPVDGEPVQAEAQSHARLWTLPVPHGMNTLLGSGGAVARMPAMTAGNGGPTTAGLHGGGSYPPLAPRPGVPGDGDDDADHRLLKRLVTLLILLLLFSLATGAVAARDSIVWAEMPNERVLLTVERGSATTGTGGAARRLDRGAQRYLAAGETVAVARRSVARLTYRGGGYALLCPSTAVVVRDVSARRDGATLVPSGTLALGRGAMLADTTPRTAAITPLALRVRAATHRIANNGPARFGAEPSATNPASVHSGRVAVDGIAAPPTGIPARCPVGADSDDTGQQGTPPATTVPPATTTVPPTTKPTTTTTTTTAPATTTTPTIGDEPPPPVTTTTPDSLVQPPPEPPQPEPEPKPEPEPPPDSDPTLGNPQSSTSRIEQSGRACRAGQTTSSISVTVRDAEDGPDALTVWFTYRLNSDPSVTGRVTMRHARGDAYLGTLGPFAAGSVPDAGGRLEITASVRDTAGNVTTSTPIHVVLGDC